MNIKFLSSVTLLLLAACGQTLAPSNDAVDIETFTKLLERTFETAPTNAEHNIRDRRVRVEAQALDGYWFYAQLNTGAERKLYRQRLSHITLSKDETAIVQKTYEFNTPEVYVDGWNTPYKLAALTPDDFKSYFQAGCEQIWTPDSKGGWLGYVDPKTCIISSKRRNKDIRIESEGYLREDIYRTNERGYEMDMTFLWGTKPGEMIDLFPVK